MGALKCLWQLGAPTTTLKHEQCSRLRGWHSSSYDDIGPRIVLTEPESYYSFRALFFMAELLILVNTRQLIVNS